MNILIIITFTNNAMPSSNWGASVSPWKSWRFLCSHGEPREIKKIPGDSWGRNYDNVTAQVLETLLEMRTQRMGLIQTEDQLRFSVEALILALKRLQGEVSGGLEMF